MEKKKQEIPLVVPVPWNNRIQTDPQGSYTGVPKERMEQPVQDVDDL